VEVEVVPILRVADADAAVRWYERLGFTKQWEHRFDPSCPAFVSIACGGARVFLSEHRGVATSQPPGWCGRLGSGAGGRHRARGKDRVRLRSGA
jgi:catechol 2,3-dioxygenase-like lactoylglutathione lyase family enzyme